MINPKQTINHKKLKSKQYDLEERSFKFALKVRNILKKIPSNIHNQVYYKQLIRSSSSIGANYIEANESLSKKDFIMRIKISKKEAKETIFWLNLLDIDNLPNLNKEIIKLLNEATELMKILGSIAEKCK